MGVKMILMNDFRSDPNELKESTLGAISRVIESGRFILGSELENLERQWSLACNVNHSIGVGNGMDAIEIALRILNIGPGDEVITTPMTAFATTLAILRVGAVPVLADIEEGTALLSITSAQRCLSTKTKAIVLVHLYGQVRSMDKWQNFSKEYGLFLVEDCAQAHLASWQGNFAGTFGDMGTYSFYPTKNLGALGDAGMVITNNKAFAEKASIIRNYGQSIRYHHPEIGMNSRLDEIQAAILFERLKWLSPYNVSRKRIAECYKKGIQNNLITKMIDPEEPSAHNYHQFVVLCGDRENLQSHLLNHQIETLIHYPIPIHHQKPCLNIKRDPNGLPVSERHANQCVSLPCHPHLRDDEVSHIIDSINSFKG